MSKQAEPSKLRVLVTRVVLCPFGVLALLMGLSYGTRADSTHLVIAFSIVMFTFGLYLLYVGIFKSGSAAVQLLALLMEPE